MASPNHKHPFRVGDEISSQTRIDAAAIRQYAKLVGDDNPLHHDKEIAEASRFRGLIASGTHTTALMMAAVASYLSERSANVGLGYSVRLRRPVHADEQLRIEWTIVSIEPSPGLSGDIITFEGKLIKSDGQIAIAATQRALVGEGLFGRSERPR